MAKQFLVGWVSYTEVDEWLKEMIFVNQIYCGCIAGKYLEGPEGVASRREGTCRPGFIPNVETEQSVLI